MNYLAEVNLSGLTGVGIGLILAGITVLAIGVFMLKRGIKRVKANGERKKAEPQWRPQNSAELGLIVLLIFGTGAVLLGVAVAGCGTLLVAG